MLATLGMFSYLYLEHLECNKNFTCTVAGLLFFYFSPQFSSYHFDSEVAALHHGMQYTTDIVHSDRTNECVPNTQ